MSFGRGGQDRRKGRALAELGGNDQLAAMAVENVLDDGKPQAGSTFLAARRDADPVETLGQPGQVLRCNARAVVGYRQDKAGAATSRFRLMGNLDANAPARLAVLQGVLN